jgi:NitT/TauT family transport system permease protein
MAEQVTNTRRLITGTVSLLMVAAVIALLLEFRKRAGEFYAPRFEATVEHLPYYGFCSFYRMLAAYVIALVFSVVYGLAAARSRVWERILIPAIDVAQSVPVVGFFPAAIYFFVALAHGSRLGVEMAAVFLIFTSQAWNMTLGVFEAVRTIPADSLETFEVFGVTRWLRLKRLLLPVCVPKLVYNSILSWVAGWYYLIACEIIAVGPAHYELPGLGSFLMRTAERGEWLAMVSGLVVLVLIIILMDLVVWQPLSVWAEKFRYELSAAPPVAGSLGMMEVFGAVGPAMAHALRALLLPVGHMLSRAAAALPSIPERGRPVVTRAGRLLRVALNVALLALAGWAIVRGAIALGAALRQPWPAEIRRIPAATVASMFRMAAAYAISLGWTLPVALAAGESARFKRFIAPTAEIVGSIPATALFPLIVVFVIRVTGGMNLASILLILTGMQWYLLFNLLAGVNQVPEDLKEAARAMGLSRVATWRKLTLPALVPSLITGSITAWGGGWNALILSEYFPYKGHVYQVMGLGALLDVATYQTGNSVMILLSLLSMVAVVLVFNRLMWRPLYERATERYRLDY